MEREIMKIENGYQINLKTNKLAKNVFLSINADGFFSDNYFDMLPGEEKTIEFSSHDEINEFESKLKILSLSSIIEK